MEKVGVILTSCGSQVAPSLIGMMRKSARFNIAIIGVDAGEKTRLVGRHFCDRFYSVPYAHERGYIPAMLEICKKNDVAIIFPASDEEALALSRSRGKFASMGTKIGCAPFTSVSKSLDKLELMLFLRKRGMRTAKFFGLEAVGDIEKRAVQLGYPGKNVVIKPRTARGSRGFRIMSGCLSSYDRLCKNEFYYTSLEEILAIFASHPEKIKNFFLMEYLPGPYYSVDMLMKRSVTAGYVCRKKIFPVGSPTQIADIVYDKDIIEYAKKVARLLKSDYFIQIEVGRNGKGMPCIIEVNPRIDATLPIVEGAGVNFFERMIEYTLSSSFRKDRSQNKGEGLRFYRYWQHIFSRQ